MESIIHYITKNNGLLLANQSPMPNMLASNRICEHGFGLVKNMLDKNPHSSTIMMESTILIQQFPIDIDCSPFSELLDLKWSARHILDSSIKTRDLQQSRVEVNMKRKRAEFEDYENKQSKCDNMKIASEYGELLFGRKLFQQQFQQPSPESTKRKKESKTKAAEKTKSVNQSIETKPSAGSKNWYKALVSTIQKSYTKKKLEAMELYKPYSKMSKQDLIDYLAKLLAGMEHRKWFKGLPKMSNETFESISSQATQSQKSSDPSFSIEEPMSL